MLIIRMPLTLMFAFYRLIRDRRSVVSDFTYGWEPATGSLFSFKNIRDLLCEKLYISSESHVQRIIGAGSVFQESANQRVLSTLAFI